MVHFSTILSLSALAGTMSVAAAPLSNERAIRRQVAKKGSVRVPYVGMRKRGLPPLAGSDGTVNKESLEAHNKVTREKYEANNAIGRKASAAKKFPSKKSKRDNAAVPLTDVIDQDVDVYYYGDVSIGTPEQVLPVDFDTGSADIWVPSKDLQTGGFFKSDDSTSFNSTGDKFSIQYGSGEVSGTVATDTISAGGLKVEKQYFALADTVSDNFVDSEFAGIFGAAFSTISNIGQPTLFENLISQGTLDKGVISFYLARGQKEGSELSIGAINEDKFTGDVTYTPVSVKTYWEVKLGKPVVGGKEVGEAFAGAIDTGTTLIYAPKETVSAIWGGVEGAALDESQSDANDEVYSYDCDSKPEIAFTFDGSDKTFAIDATDLSIGTNAEGKCVGAIIGSDFQDSEGTPLSIVGDVFLKSWVSIYDFDNEQVGFAEAK